MEVKLSPISLPKLKFNNVSLLKILLPFSHEGPSLYRKGREKWGMNLVTSWITYFRVESHIIHPMVISSYPRSNLEGSRPIAICIIDLSDLQKGNS